MWYVSDVVAKNFDERKQKAIEIIKNSGLSYTGFGIFGSYARGEYTALSDIDFCIITDKKPARSTLGALREDLSMIDVDVTVVSSEYFQNDTSEFAKQLRRDFTEVV